MRTECGLKEAGGFADDAPFFVDETFVDFVGVEAPAGGEEVDFLGVGGAGFVGRIRGDIRGIKIAVGFQREVGFGWGDGPLVPEGFAGPGIATNDAAGIQLRPGVVVEDGIRDKELHVTDFAAEFEQKAETGVDVIIRIGQGGAEDKDPAVDRRGDEQFLVAIAGQAFKPGTGLGIMEGKGGLDGHQVLILNCKPGGWSMEQRILKRGDRMRSGGANLQIRFAHSIAGPPPMNNQNRHEHPDGQDEPENRKEQSRNDFVIHSTHTTSTYDRILHLQTEIRIKPDLVRIFLITGSSSSGVPDFRGMNRSQIRSEIQIDVLACSRGSQLTGANNFTKK